MTRCTICAQPTPGSDDDDEAYCAWCEAANLAGGEAAPLARGTRLRGRVAGWDEAAWRALAALDGAHRGRRAQPPTRSC